MTYVARAAAWVLVAASVLQSAARAFGVEPLAFFGVYGATTQSLVQLALTLAAAWGAGSIWARQRPTSTVRTLLQALGVSVAAVVASVALLASAQTSRLLAVRVAGPSVLLTLLLATMGVLLAKELAFAGDKMRSPAQQLLAGAAVLPLAFAAALAAQLCGVFDVARVWWTAAALTIAAARFAAASLPLANHGRGWRWMHVAGALGAIGTSLLLVAR